MKPLSPITAYFFIQAIYNALFMAMLLVSTIYRVDVVGLNPFELLLAASVYRLVAFLAEVPTGVVADAYSRKLSILIGWFLIGIGFIVEGSIPIFGAVLLGLSIAAVGDTFISGALWAWIAGEVEDALVQDVMIRGDQVGRIIGIVGTISAMFVGSFNLLLVYQASGIGFILFAIIMYFRMPESRFTSAADGERETWGKLQQTFGAGFRYVRASRFLILIFIIELCYGLVDPGLTQNGGLSEAHLLEDFAWPTYVDWEPVVWLGLISIFNGIINLGVMEWVKRRYDGATPHQVARGMRLFTTATLVTIVGFAFAPGFELAVLIFVVGKQLQRANFSLYDPWLTRQISPEVRATVLSMWAQVNAIGQVIGGPIIGAIAVATTLPIGYAFLALLLLPVPILLTMILREKSPSI